MSDPQPVCMACAIDAQFCLLFACGDVARASQAALIAARENGNLLQTCLYVLCM